MLEGKSSFKYYFDIYLWFTVFRYLKTVKQYIFWNPKEMSSNPAFCFLLKHIRGDNVRNLLIWFTRNIPKDICIEVKKDLNIQSNFGLRFLGD